MENISVEIDRGHDSNIIIICIYRPPDMNFPTFLSEMRLLLDKLRDTNKIIFLGGDFNLNLLNHNVDVQVTQFVDLLISYNHIPTISRTTSVGESTNTLLDMLFTNSLCPASSGVVAELSLSDHFPIFLATTLRDADKTLNCVNYRRKITEVNIARFNTWLLHRFADFGEIDNPETAVNTFCNVIKSKIDEFLPVLKVNRKTAALKPLISPGILTSINKKIALYKLYLRNKTLENLTRFKTYKNLLLVIIRNAKKKHYQELISKNKGNSKKIWEILNEVTGLQKRKYNHIKCLKTEGVTVNDGKDVANVMNDFFTSIDVTLAETIPITASDPTSFIRDEVRDTVFCTL